MRYTSWMVVNLYADHLLQPERNNRIRPPEEIWYATTERPAYFEHAARLVGLSHAEFRAFQLALLDGLAVRVRLPRHLDAIAGDHAGHLYAVPNATIGTTHAGWPSAYLVTLADGAKVYVPDSSGSLSLVRPHHEAQRSSTVVYGARLRRARATAGPPARCRAKVRTDPGRNRARVRPETRAEQRGVGFRVTPRRGAPRLSCGHDAVSRECRPHESGTDARAGAERAREIATVFVYEGARRRTRG